MVCMFTFSSWYGTTSASRRKGLRIGSANIRNRERSAVLTANSVGAFGAATSCINLILSIVLLRRFSVSLEQLTDCTPTGDVLGCRQVGRILTKKRKASKNQKRTRRTLILSTRMVYLNICVYKRKLNCQIVRSLLFAAKTCIGLFSKTNCNIH